MFAGVFLTANLTGSEGLEFWHYGLDENLGTFGTSNFCDIPCTGDIVPLNLINTKLSLKSLVDVQWIPVNWDTSGLEYFVPIRQLPNYMKLHAKS
jgi:hypothetical protein